MDLTCSTSYRGLHPSKTLCKGISYSVELRSCFFSIGIISVVFIPPKIKPHNVDFTIRLPSKWIEHSSLKFDERVSKESSSIGITTTEVKRQTTKSLSNVIEAVCLGFYICRCHWFSDGNVFIVNHIRNSQVHQLRVQLFSKIAIFITSWWTSFTSEVYYWHLSNLSPK